MQRIRARVAEAAALADVPVELVLLGKTVRVCHEKAGFKSFGMTGTVTEQKIGQVTVVQEHLKSRCTVQFDEVQEVDMEKLVAPVLKKALNRMNKADKRLAITVMNAKEGIRGLGAQERLTDAHLQAWYEYLQWQYNEPRLRMMQASEALVLATADANSIEHVCLKSAAQEHLLAAGVLVVPVFHEHNGPGTEHWTALAVETSGGEEVAVTAVRYYDSLSRPSQECAARAQKILRYLLDNSAIQLPAKRNEWHQTNGVDCGISVCHYMEEELRTARGEGLGNQWPDPVHTRDRLQKYLEQLKREWAKWRLEQHKEGGAPVEILDNEELKAVTKEHQTACQVWAEAHKSPGETIVFEYRCSRCRWSPSGVGCDSCNPLKKLERMKRMHQVLHLCHHQQIRQ